MSTIYIGHYDQQDELQFASDYFVRQGYRVVTVSDGNALWQLIETERPDVVVLGAMLPGKNAFEIVASLNQLYPNDDIYKLLLTHIEGDGEPLKT